MQTVLIEYVIGETTPIEHVESEIRTFVAGIAALGVGIRYASHRKRDVPRAYAHVALVPDKQASATLQAAPFFAHFAKFLSEVCESKPQVTTLDVVASTDS